MVAAMAAQSAERPLVGEFSQRFTDEALSQRLCVSIAANFDFLS